LKNEKSVAKYMDLISRSLSCKKNVDLFCQPSLSLSLSQKNKQLIGLTKTKMQVAKLNKKISKK
jgi:hypothetical protein